MEITANNVLSDATNNMRKFENVLGAERQRQISSWTLTSRRNYRPKRWGASYSRLNKIPGIHIKSRVKGTAKEVFHLGHGTKGRTRMKS